MLPLGLQGGSELCRQPWSDVQSRFGHLAPVVLHLVCSQDSKIEEQLSHQCHHCHHCHPSAHLPPLSPLSPFSAQADQGIFSGNGDPTQSS